MRKFPLCALESQRQSRATAAKTYQPSFGIPRVKNIYDIVTAHTQILVHESPRLAECGHDTVLDSVMDHLDKMTAASSTNVGDTRPAEFISSGDLGQHGQERFYSPSLTARHQ
jgi:hypothetical protein